MNKIKIIKNRSDIGAGTRGSDMGIDAIEIAAINCGSDWFSSNNLLYLLKTTSYIDAKSSGPTTVLMLK